MPFQVVVTSRGEKWTTAGVPGLLHDVATFTTAKKAATLLNHTVPCAPLTHVLDEVLSHVDYLSVDVEGAEEVVLSTIDWSRLSVHLVGVEQSKTSTRKKNAVRTLLRRAGFVHVATQWVYQRTLGDELFMNGTYLRAHVERVASVVLGERIVQLTKQEAPEADLGSRLLIAIDNKMMSQKV
jgi:hypothetical protein